MRQIYSWEDGEEMRIAFITPEFVTEESFDGGLANYTYRVSLCLKSMGHEPIVFVASSSEDASFFFNGIEVQRVQTKNRLGTMNDEFRKIYGSIPEFGRSLNSLYVSWMLNERVKQVHGEKPLTILHYTNYLATSYFAIREIPSVLRVSSYQPMWLKAYDAFDHSLARASEIYLERCSFLNVDALLGPSEIIGSAVQQEVGRPVEIIETPFVYDVTECDDSKYKEKLSDKKYLLFFGTIGLLKGVKAIADMLSEFLENHLDYYFVFVGKDSLFMESSMMNYVYEKVGQYKTRVLHFEKIPHSQLYPIIQHAEVVVLPSRIDNFPNTCLEAMAHEKIVIGTYGTSFEQLLKDGENGFLCNSDDHVSLLLTIQKVLQLSEDEKKKIGRCAGQRIGELSPDKVVRQLVNFYEKVLGNFKK